MHTDINRLSFTLGTALIFGFASISLGNAQENTSHGRADLAALTLDSAVILRAHISKTSKLNAKLAPDVATGFRRLLVRADIENLLVAPGYIPPRIEYLVDVPVDSRGKLPQYKGASVILFLNSGHRENQYQLTKPWAQVAWTEDRDAYVRKLASEAVANPDIKSMSISGFGQAFHVAGSLPGEGETQIFINTDSGNPVSLVVLSRPGQKRTYGVATGDIIDESAGGIASGSLLWYHIACGLPAEIPPKSTETQTSVEANKVRDDYQFVRKTIGACDQHFKVE